MSQKVFENINSIFQYMHKSDTTKQMISVFSIDAWVGFHYDVKGWFWNRWHKIGEISMDCYDLFRDNPYTYLNQLQGFDIECDKVTIEDDGFNLIIKNRDENRPLYAIVYNEVLSITQCPCHDRPIGPIIIAEKCA